MTSTHKDVIKKIRSDESSDEIVKVQFGVQSTPKEAVVNESSDENSECFWWT